MREAFEAWAKEEWPAWVVDDRMPDGSYANHCIDGAWAGYQAGLAAGAAAEREACAKVCEKRAELRFEAHGYTEPDTNASYYIGEYRDLGDSLDEEDADCAAAIRARSEEKR